MSDLPPLNKSVSTDLPLANLTTAFNSMKKGKQYEIKEIEEEVPIIVDKVTKISNSKQQISIRDAFPKIIHLNAKTEANALGMTELRNNTSSQTSVEL